MAGVASVPDDELLSGPEALPASASDDWFGAALEEEDEAEMLFGEPDDVAPVTPLASNPPLAAVAAPELAHDLEADIVLQRVLVHSDVAQQITHSVTTLKPQHGTDVHALAEALSQLHPTYHVHVREATGARHRTFALTRLRHQYIVLHPPGAPAPRPGAPLHLPDPTIVVEPAFRDSLRIHSPSPRFQAIQDRLPDVYVAPAGHFATAVNSLAAEIAASFKSQSLDLPPWRSRKALASMWDPTLAHDTPIHTPPTPATPTPPTTLDKLLAAALCPSLPPFPTATLITTPPTTRSPSLIAAPLTPTPSQPRLLPLTPPQRTTTPHFKPQACPPSLDTPIYRPPNATLPIPVPGRSQRLPAPPQHPMLPYHSPNAAPPMPPRTPAPRATPAPAAHPVKPLGIYKPAPPPPAPFVLSQHPAPCPAAVQPAPTAQPPTPQSHPTAAHVSMSTSHITTTTTTVTTVTTTTTTTAAQDGTQTTKTVTTTTTTTSTAAPTPSTLASTAATGAAAPTSCDTAAAQGARTAQATAPPPVPPPPAAPSPSPAPLLPIHPAPAPVVGAPSAPAAPPRRPSLLTPPTPHHPPAVGAVAKPASTAAGQAPRRPALLTHAAQHDPSAGLAAARATFAPHRHSLLALAAAQDAPAVAKAGKKGAGAGATGPGRSGLAMAMSQVAPSTKGAAAPGGPRLVLSNGLKGIGSSSAKKQAAPTRPYPYRA